MNNDLLKGVCDIHLHCRPDSRERCVDEYGFMQDAMRAGYRAVMFGDKVNVWAAKKAIETSGRLCRCIPCPQHLDIPNLLKQVKETMGK